MSIFRKAPVLIQIEATVNWQVARDPNDGHWFGVCQALNLNAVGDTWTDFQECANEATEMLFQTLLKSGELEKFLQAQGWRSARPLPPPGTRARFEIPYGIEHRSRVKELTGSFA